MCLSYHVIHTLHICTPYLAMPCCVCRDTAGQERFRTLTNAYFRGAAVTHTHTYTAHTHTHIYSHMNTYTNTLTHEPTHTHILSHIHKHTHTRTHTHSHTHTHTHTLTQGALLLYDITQRATYVNVADWMDSVQTHGSEIQVCMCNSCPLLSHTHTHKTNGQMNKGPTGGHWPCL